METLSWEPVRRGRIFCAPACGAKCTWKAHQAAKRAAAKAAAALGPGWAPRVWENLGWHWSVNDVTGYVKVHPMGDGAFTAFVGEGLGGRWTVDAPTVEGAVAAARARCREEYAALFRAFMGVKWPGVPEAEPWGPLGVTARSNLGFHVLDLLGVDTSQPLEVDPAGLVMSEIADRETRSEALGISIHLRRAQLDRLPKR